MNSGYGSESPSAFRRCRALRLRLLPVLLVVAGLPAAAGTVWYQYDALNRLTHAVYDDAEIEYSYDAAGNRLAVVVRDPDGDGDRMPDDWEQVIADARTDDDIRAPADVRPDDDFDGDGFTNIDEWQRGTDPTRYVLTLPVGWNLISIAHQFSDNSTTALFGPRILGPAWSWNGAQYQPADKLLPLLGYWVYAATDFEIVLPAYTMHDRDGDGTSDEDESQQGSDPDL